MDLKAEKLQLIQQIIQINDAVLISSIKNLLGYALKNQENSAEAVTDFWENLSEEQKAKIDLSIKQLDAGEGKEHQQVMSTFREKYKR